MSNMGSFFPATSYHGTMAMLPTLRVVVLDPAVPPQLLRMKIALTQVLLQIGLAYVAGMSPARAKWRLDH